MQKSTDLGRRSERLLLGSLAASGAHAQAAPPSSVTLYGLIDAGVEYVNKVDGKGSIQRMPSNTGS